MPYPGRSREQLRRTLLRKLVEKGLSREVSRGHSTIRKIGRTEQFTMFKYTKIMLTMNQNKCRGKYKTYS